jgi:hypothetical protein
MAYTVRLCRDASGWFATLRERIPPDLVHAQVRVGSRALAYELLEVGRDVAKQLDRRDDAAAVARAIARPRSSGKLRPWHAKRTVPDRLAAA